MSTPAARNLSVRNKKPPLNGKNGNHMITIKGAGKASGMRKSKRKKPDNPRSSTDIDELIGQRLRIKRNEAGLSQGELGDKLGVSFQQVQKYEKGKNRIHSVRLFEIAHMLGTTMDYFFTDLNREMHEGGSAYGDFMMTRDGPMIIEAMIAIESPELRRAVIRLARDLAGLADE